MTELNDKMGQVLANKLAEMEMSGEQASYINIPYIVVHGTPEKLKANPEIKVGAVFLVRPDRVDEFKRLVHGEGHRPKDSLN